MKEKKFGKDMVFREGTQRRIIEDIINEIVGIDFKTGRWEWINPAEIQKIIIKKGYNFFTIGNGSTMFNNDRGLGLKYYLQKDPTNHMVRSLGWPPHYNASINNTIPNNVKKYYKTDKLCVFCGQTRDIKIDHKDKNKKDGDDDIDNYQPVCVWCNTQKREDCNSCNKFHKRYDARELGYSVGWVDGDEKYSPSREGCRGCYKHDPVYFRSKLSYIPTLNNETNELSSNENKILPLKNNKEYTIFNTSVL